MRSKFHLILLITLLCPACALADTIWIGAGVGVSALELKNITITGISEGKLLYQSAGRENNRDLSTIARIQIEDEPAFSAAEEAFAAGKADIAKSAYASAAQSIRKPWLRERIDARLAQLAPRNGAQPAAPAPAAPAAQRGGSADQAIAAASAAIQNKDFTTAINAINASRALFIDPAMQAQALFHFAEAQAGLAAAKNDVASWQDAALTYMRVPAHIADSPLAPRALLQVAQIQQQKLNDAAAARALYQQIVNEYPNDPAAATAKLQLQQSR